MPGEGWPAGNHGMSSLPNRVREHLKELARRRERSPIAIWPRSLKSNRQTQSIRWETRLNCSCERITQPKRHSWPLWWSAKYETGCLPRYFSMSPGCLTDLRDRIRTPRPIIPASSRALGIIGAAYITDNRERTPMGLAARSSPGHSDPTGGTPHSDEEHHCLSGRVGRERSQSHHCRGT